MGSSAIVKYGSEEKKFSTEDRTGCFIKAFSKNPHEQIQNSILWAKTVGGNPKDFGGKEEGQLNETYKSINKELKKIKLIKTFEKTKSTPENTDSSKMTWVNPKYLTPKN